MKVYLWMSVGGTVEKWKMENLCFLRPIVNV